MKITIEINGKLVLDGDFSLKDDETKESTSLLDRSLEDIANSRKCPFEQEPPPGDSEPWVGNLTDQEKKDILDKELDTISGNSEVYKYFLRRVKTWVFDKQGQKIIYDKTSYSVKDYFVLDADAVIHNRHVKELAEKGIGVQYYAKTIYEDLGIKTYEDLVQFLCSLKPERQLLLVEENC